MLFTLFKVGLDLPEINKFQDETESNIQKLHPSDVAFLTPTQAAQKNGYCSNTGSISYSWSTSPSRS
ncbi:MAG: hypothetical protein ACTSQR_01775, partial [Promethearchaeota archaeon]